MSGGSRGIGLALAVRAAQDGARVVFISKTDKPDPRLPGTVHSAAERIEAAGGTAVPIVGDIRDMATVERAVQTCVDKFGGIDTVVNNASAIDLRGVGELELKRFELILDVNVRGTYQLISAALPYLSQSPRAHVLTLSPPLNPDPRWLEVHAPYTLTKYGMTMLTLGVAHQYRGRVAANCLWPQTLIATAAVNNIAGGEAAMRASRNPQIMADAAAILLSRGLEHTGHCHLDAEVLKLTVRGDLSKYATIAGTPDEALQGDLFV